MKVRKNEIEFLLKFFAIFAVAEFLLFVLDFSALENFIAKGAASYFNLAFQGNLIFVGGWIFEITSSCTGLVSTGILAAIIFSLKKPDVKRKLAIFLSGAALLIILNYFRVFLVIGIAKDYSPAAGQIAHVLSWFSTAAFVIALWHYFTKKITGVKNFSHFL